MRKNNTNCASVFANNCCRTNCAICPCAPKIKTFVIYMPPINDYKQIVVAFEILYKQKHLLFVNHFKFLSDSCYFRHILFIIACYSLYIR
ncbi:hypothetical protein LCUFL03_160023 [Latilactobacillus curvatus]|nr:hypothetical protein LCUFL03_160023 [Latilactobacillus curvatus]